MEDFEDAKIQKERFRAAKVLVRRFDDRVALKFMSKIPLFF